jgi:hypothetical protein
MKTTVEIIDGIPVTTNTFEDFDYATDLQKESWLSVCNGCEFKGEDNCKSCGCLLESLMNLTTAKCPLNKW